MRIMRLMRQIQGLWGVNLFCSGFFATKQISRRVFGDFCLILPHNPHDLPSCLTSISKKMRVMRVDEGGLFIGLILPTVKIEIGSRPFHEANMRLEYAHPHVLAVGLVSCGLFLRCEEVDHG